MKKTILSIVAILLGFLPIWLAGKNMGSFPEPHDPEAIHITFSAPASPQHRAAYEQCLRIFMRRNPHIFVEFKPGLHSSYEAFIQTQMLADRAPDVFWWQNEVYPAFAEDGVLLDLKPYADRDPEWNYEDYFDLCFEECRIGDQMFAVPLQWGASIIFYNADLFEEVGIDYRDETWTWETFVETAEKLTRDRDGDGRMDQFGVEMIRSMEWSYPWVWMAGGEAFNEDKTQSLMDSPEAIRAFNYLEDIFNHRQVQLTDYAGSVGEHVASLSDPFIEGTVAMKFSGPYYCDTLKAAPHHRWRVAYFPRNPETGIRNTRLYQDLICVSRRTEHPEETWELVKFLLGPVTQRMVCRFGSIPIRKEIAYTTFNREDTPWDEQRLVNAIEHAHLQAITPFYYEMDRTGAKYFQQMMAISPRDREPVELSLKRFAADVNEMIAREREKREKQRADLSAGD
jgi:multiple sugar transport system substrate-binding protein